MKRLVALCCILLAVSAPAAFAQTADEVVAGLDDGLYVDSGVTIDSADLTDAVARARNAGVGLYVVILEDDPPSGAATFADAVLDRLGSGTVLVLSASGEGMASSEVGQPALERALDAGFEAGGGDEGYVAAVVSSLTAASPSTGAETDDGGGSAGLIIMLVVVVGLVLLVWWLIRRSNKASQQRRGSLISEARSEIKEQLDSMANTILEITDIVAASDSAEDNQYLEEAGSTYTAALEYYESASDLGSLEQLSDRLDEARWQLDAAAAIAEGREAPAKPEKKDRPVCFFDPTHRDATELVDIKTATGSRTVRVCRADAERIKRGSQPKPRMIEVEGRRMPAPMAPRSHGGGGMDWLETFSVVAGGAGEAMSYDWGRRESRGRRAGAARPKPAPTATEPKPRRSRAGRSRRRRR